MVISTKMHINIKLEMCEGVFDKKKSTSLRSVNGTKQKRKKRAHSLSIQSERLYKHVMLRLSLIMRLLHIFLSFATPYLTLEHVRQSVVLLWHFLSSPHWNDKIKLHVIFEIKSSKRHVIRCRKIAGENGDVISFCVYQEMVNIQIKVVAMDKYIVD